MGYTISQVVQDFATIHSTIDQLPCHPVVWFGVFDPLHLASDVFFVQNQDLLPRILKRYGGPMPQYWSLTMGYRKDGHGFLWNMMITMW